jgi:hypothetical protein
MAGRRGAVVAVAPASQLCASSRPCPCRTPPPALVGPTPQPGAGRLVYAALGLPRVVAAFPCAPPSSTSHARHNRLPAQGSLVNWGSRCFVSCCLGACACRVVTSHSSLPTFPGCCSFRSASPVECTPHLCCHARPHGLHRLHGRSAAAAGAAGAAAGGKNAAAGVAGMGSDRHSAGPAAGKARTRPRFCPGSCRNRASQGHRPGKQSPTADP